MTTAEIFLPWPDRKLSPNRAWTDEELSRLQQMHGIFSIADIAKELGRSTGGIRNKVSRLGISKPNDWSDAEIDILTEAYQQAGADGVVNLSALAERLGRHKANICRKARNLGLGTNQKRRTVEVRKDAPKYSSADERKSALSVIRKKWFEENEHPRGMKGKKHTTETRARISAASKAMFLMMDEDQKSEMYLKGMKTKAAKGIGPAAIKRGSWQAGWREIGGKRNFYRSMWEANYARYLQWLKERSEIADWQHEPETFWFEKIKRGVRSYKPDFRVWENNGFSCLHEVKGWMDARSRTCLARMAKYHPSEKIILIDEKQYRAIRLKVMRLVPGWEDSARDARM